MKIDRIDHVVLTVADIARTMKWYSRALGVDTVTFAEGRRALVFGEQKLNLHEKGKEFEPKAARPTPGSVDLCVTTTVPLDMVVVHLRSVGVRIELGPVDKVGARGMLRSVYVRDPDGNLIEIANES